MGDVFANKRCERINPIREKLIKSGQLTSYYEEENKIRNIPTESVGNEKERAKLICDGFLTPKEKVYHPEPVVWHFGNSERTPDNNDKLIADGYLAPQDRIARDYFTAVRIGEAERKWRHDHNFVNSKSEFGNIDKKIELAKKSGRANCIPNEVMQNYESAWGLNGCPDEMNDSEGVIMDSVKSGNNVHMENILLRAGYMDTKYLNSNYVESPDDFGNIDKKIELAGKDPFTGGKIYPKKIADDVKGKFKQMWGLAYRSYADWKFDETVIEKEGKKVPVLTDKAFGQCMKISGDLFGRVRELLCEGLDYHGREFFDMAYKYAVENPDNCDVATLRRVMLDTIGKIGMLKTMQSVKEDFSKLKKEYYGIGQWLYREPAFRGVHLGFFERRIGGLRGMALGLGLYYFRQKRAVRTGDDSFLAAHADEIDAFKEWCDEKSKQYTDASFVDLDIFNFSVRGIRVVDGKLENESLRPYVRDVIVPELLSFDMYEPGTLESIRKIQFGCALAVTVGMNENWFIRLANNDMAAYCDEILRLSNILGRMAGTRKIV